MYIIICMRIDNWHNSVVFRVYYIYTRILLISYYYRWADVRNRERVK